MKLSLELGEASIREEVFEEVLIWIRRKECEMERNGEKWQELETKGETKTGGDKID